MAEVLDWRSARLADKLMTLDREQFAVEFLRRNPAYVEDYNTTQALIAAGDVPADAGLAAPEPAGRLTDQPTAGPAAPRRAHPQEAVPWPHAT